MGYMVDNSMLEKIIDNCIELAKLQQEEESRRMVISTGKKGVITYLEQVWETAGLDKDQVSKNISEAELNLKDGVYTIDSSSIENLGIKFQGSYK